MNLANAINFEDQVQYDTGDKDSRPWGYYEVLNVGVENKEEFCEKRIGLKPFKALSLQRHHGRREVWHVEEGVLTVICNGYLYTLYSGESIIIPLKAPHCMINLTNSPVIVREKQIGICREEDNDRLCDLSGRDVLDINQNDIVALESKEIYLEVTKPLQNMQN